MSDKATDSPSVKRSSSKKRERGSNYKDRDEPKERDSHRDKDKEKEKEKDKDKERERDKDKDKEGSHIETSSTSAPLETLVLSVHSEIGNLIVQQKRLEGMLDQLRVPIASPDVKLSKKNVSLKEDIERLKLEKNELMKKVVEIGEVVTLNVGGTLYMTTKTTLRKYRPTMLSSMFSGRHRLVQDKDGHFFLDRNGRIFGHVLSFLRCGQLPIFPLESLYEIKIESDFFAIEPLSRLLEDRIQEFTKRQFAVLRYNENSNYNNLSWQGITQPLPLTLGGSLYKSIDQVLTEVDQAGWELTNLSGDGSAEGGWMYVFKRKARLVLEEVELFTINSGSSSGTPRALQTSIGPTSTSNPNPSTSGSNPTSSAKNDDTPSSKSTGVLLVKNEKRIQREHSGSF